MLNVLSNACAKPSTKSIRSTPTPDARMEQVARKAFSMVLQLIHLGSGCDPHQWRTLYPMKKLLIPLAMLLMACSTYAQSYGASLDVKAFKAALDKDDALLLDVRTPEEFAQGHIEAAANEDWLGGELLKDVSGIDKTKPVLLYCAVGRRSAEAMAAMIKAGFTDVRDLKGGINAWEAEKLPVITQ